ncbi:phage tail protein [Xanthobacteraceae bacterium Astr-EGSB]|uniref:phage tail protein n=1 Tax=Astrobacterium formosum TaxID=3069710 RepID=UPI0027AFDBCE|nr:phage tail protein [Xanthobacteraceae bacterium Astr-EGSB]
MLLLLTIAVVLSLVAPAEAGFLVPLIGGAVFAATAAGAALSFALNVVGAFAVSYVAGKLLAKSKTQDSGVQAGGTQLDIRVDADVPMSLLVGYAVTAGSLVDARTYGKRGDDDNSDLIEIVSLGDCECDGLEAAIVEGQQRALGADDGYRGQVVDGYDGKLALKFYNGRQTAADAFSVAAFGSAAQPWDGAAIGTSVTYVRLHSIYNREKVPGRLSWKFVVRGKPMYDPRKDSTVSGGSGTHRFADLATHEWTRNLAVIAYNILRGIYILDGNGDRQFFYGLENTRAAQLPLDVWFAAMNECDVAIALAGGGTEPQYTAGGEITLDTEPLEAIKELIKACGGRFVEIGGIYKLYVGAPGLPVMAIDDGSLIAAVEDRFKPFLPLESRINHITGKYTSPADGWIDAVAPARSREDWRAEDGRRKSADLDAPMVQSGTQMQRLMEQFLNRSRRERKHILPLPPPAFVLEPGDVIQWTSLRNGYTAKEFEVDSADYATNLDTTISATEVDGTDFDWDIGQELPLPDGLIVTTRPAGKVVTDFDVAAFVFLGDRGTKRPAIRLTWEDPEDGDAIGVSYEIRSFADISNATTYSTTDADVVASGMLTILAGLQPLTIYQVRARFISFNGYSCDWSLWQPVTTPDTRIDRDELSRSMDARLRQLEEQLPDILTVRKELDALSGAVNTQVTTLVERLGRVNIGAGARYQENKASVEIALAATAGIDSALAELEIELGAQIEDMGTTITAGGRIRFVTSTTVSGAIASVAIEVNTGTPETPTWSKAGIYLDAIS